MPSAREAATPTLGASDAPASPEHGPGTVRVGSQDRALSTRQLAWRRFKRHKLAMASAVVLVKSRSPASKFTMERVIGRIFPPA